MIDWDGLIGAGNQAENSGITPMPHTMNGAENQVENSEITPENIEITPSSGARPTIFNDDSKEVGRLKSSIHKGLEGPAPLAPPAPLKNKGVGQEQENNQPDEAGASDNYCAGETYPVNPIAVILLMTCCNKATFNKEEILEAIWQLQTIPQLEQIRLWAILCQEHGIDPYHVIYPFTLLTPSSNQGISCQGCKHIDMRLIPTDKRPVYRFTCKQHHPILEAYYLGERILIAPESCCDYLPTV